MLNDQNKTTNDEFSINLGIISEADKYKANGLVPVFATQLKALQSYVGEELIVLLPLTLNKDGEEDDEIKISIDEDNNLDFVSIDDRSIVIYPKDVEDGTYFCKVKLTDQEGNINMYDQEIQVIFINETTN